MKKPVLMIIFLVAVLSTAQLASADSRTANGLQFQNILVSISQSSSLPEFATTADDGGALGEKAKVRAMMAASVPVEVSAHTQATSLILGTSLAALHEEN